MHIINTLSRTFFSGKTYYHTIRQVTEKEVTLKKKDKKTQIKKDTVITI